MFLTASGVIHEPKKESAIDKEKHHLPFDTTFICLNTSVLRDLFQNGDISDNEVDNFLKSARIFYQETLRYILIKLNMESEESRF